MTITEIRDAVSQVATAYPVISVDLFGSFARGDCTESSDIDLLVQFDETVASLFDVSGLKLDLEEVLRTRVDVIAGPLRKDSRLIIDAKVRLYEA